MKKITMTSKTLDFVANIISTSNSDVSFNMAQKLIRNKDVIVDGARIKENMRVFPGQEITYFYNPTENNDKFFEIVYEDEFVLVVFKKRGIEVCDGEETTLKTLIENTLDKKLFAMHRLDRNTEGLVLFAKNKLAEKEIKLAFKSHRIEKLYLAEVVGAVNFEKKVDKAYLVKDQKTSYVFIQKNKSPEAERIETSIKKIRTSGGTSLVEVQIEAGKTHQIRAHLAYLGYPIIGDGKYGKNADNKKYKEKYQKLCAYKLVFNFEKGSFLAYLNDKKFEIEPTFVQGGKNG